MALLVRGVSCFRKNRSSVGILYVEYKLLHSVSKLEIFSRTGSDTLTFQSAPRPDNLYSEWGGKILLRATFFVHYKRVECFCDRCCVREGTVLAMPFSRGIEPGLAEVRLEKAASGAPPSQPSPGRLGS